MTTVDDVLFSHHLDLNVVADFLIELDRERAEPEVTPLKLQKLLYLAQANYLASTGERLFDEPIEAFEHGPVVYRMFQRFKGRQIIAARQDSASRVADALPEDAAQFLRDIWSRFKDYSAGQLWSLTHRQDPWKDHYKPNCYRVEIPDASMSAYFRHVAPLAERVFHPAVTLVPVGFLESLSEDKMASEMKAFWSQVSDLWGAIERLTADHDLGDFSCGLEEIDAWLTEKALANGHSVATHVCLDSDGAVVAFFALKTVIVSVEGLTSAQRRNSMAGQSVGILLCQMGVRHDLQKGGGGKSLLREAMRFALMSHARSPVQLFVVDAHNEGLVGFYEAAGLKRVPETLRLLAPMGAVQKALA